MELRQLLRVGRKWWWLLMLSTILAVGVSYAVSLSLPRYYRASATIRIGQIIEQRNPDAASMAVVEHLAQSYSEMAHRRPVLQGVIDQLGLTSSPGALATQIITRLVPGTQLLEVTVTDPDPKEAALIANEVAHQLVLQSPSARDQENQAQRAFIQSQVTDLQRKIEEAQTAVLALQRSITAKSSAAEINDARAQLDALQIQISSWQDTYGTLLGQLEPSATNYLTIVEPAVIPTQPVARSLFQSILLAAAVGLLLAVVVALVVEYVDDTVREAADVESIPGMRVLAHISHFGTGLKGTGAENLVAVGAPLSPAAEEFRSLRTSLQHVGLENPGLSILVTSVSPHAGRTMMTANLAASFAQMGKRVIAIDADLRNPMLHTVFGVSPKVFLEDLLQGDVVDAANALVPVKGLSLFVLPSKAASRNPSDLLGSPRMEQLLGKLAASADVVLVDGPALPAGSDAKALAPKVRGVLLVLVPGKQRIGALRGFKEELESLGANVVGSALNDWGKSGSHSRTGKSRRTEASTLAKA